MIEISPQEAERVKQVLEEEIGRAPDISSVCTSRLWGHRLISTVFACRTLIKTQDYLDVFARFKQKENIEAVERMLTSKTELELFERSQLGIDIHSNFLP